MKSLLHRLLLSRPLVPSSACTRRTVFVDIDPETFNLSPDKGSQSGLPLRPRPLSRYIYLALAAEMDPILEIAASHKLAVIEDAAQAIGARYKGKPTGSMGTIGCVSVFFPSKNLGGAGDGGLVTTNDRSLAEKLKILRLHGSQTKYRYDQLGINSRLDAIQAAILRVKLKHLDAWTRERTTQCRALQRTLCRI